MRQLWTALVLLFAATSCGRAQVDKSPLPDCVWCGADEAPANLTSRVTIPGANEPGTWITIDGKVFLSDGKTPASGVTMYLYHTNVQGLYEKKGDETGNGRRHGYLRGWLKTDADGSYQFTTIRPAAYPSRTEEQHIHITVKVPGEQEIALDSFLFDDDPLLTPQRRARLENRGGSGILKLTHSNGRWIGRRDIILPP